MQRHYVVTKIEEKMWGDGKLWPSALSRPSDLWLKGSLFFTWVSPSLTPASSSSNNNKTKGVWAPDGDDLLKEQVKWKQACTNQAPHLLDQPPIINVPLYLWFISVLALVCMLRWHRYLGRETHTHKHTATRMSEGIQRHFTGDTFWQTCH